MADELDYTPPKVWKWVPGNGGKFANINRPIAGATHDKDLPQGEHPHQLYSLATPNGIKVTVLFEELLEAGYKQADYDAWLINIQEGDQFSSGFVDINPNSKIPALLDKSTKEPTRLFESGSIMTYLAEKYDAFLPSSGPARVQTFNWLFWQMGSAPYLGGGFGHFYAYAPKKFEYPIERFSMEVKRQLDVLDKHLEHHQYLNESGYSIADMAVFPWYGGMVRGLLYEAGEFLSVEDYTHVLRWAKEIAERPAVKRGTMVNKAWGEPSGQLRERHSAGDFKTSTWDKIGPEEV